MVQTDHTSSLTDVSTIISQKISALLDSIIKLAVIPVACAHIQSNMRTDEERQKAEAKRRCYICGGLFKNERGVKIHQGKSKCKEQSQQRRAPELTQSNLFKFVKGVHQSVEEVQGQEANHSAPDFPAQPTQSIGRVEPECPKDFERKPRLNLPPAADRRWAQLDNNLNTILENTLKEDAAKKI